MIHKNTRSADTGKVNVLGVGVSAINMSQAVGVIDRWIRNRDPNYVCVTSVHGIVESQGDARLRQIHNSAGLVTPDGIPLVWFMKSHGENHVERVYGPDLMLAVMQLSLEHGYTHFLYGATDETLRRLQDRLERRFPGVRIVGKHAPPFRPLTFAEDVEIVEKINRSGADIVWVGLSTPKQELWMADHVGRLNAPVTLGVGAAFDFHAGLKRQAPSVIRRNGLEWLFRLLTEPRRLWKRYFSIVPYFAFNAVCQRVGLKSYVLDR